MLSWIIACLFLPYQCLDATPSEVTFSHLAQTSIDRITGTNMTVVAVSAQRKRVMRAFGFDQYGVQGITIVEHYMSVSVITVS